MATIRPTLSIASLTTRDCWLQLPLNKPLIFIEQTQKANVLGQFGDAFATLVEILFLIVLPVFVCIIFTNILIHQHNVDSETGLRNCHRIRRNR
jgi:hypothetical protein